MKLWVLSDLHCSLAELAELLSSPPEHDVCVLAGDIAAGLVSQIDVIDSVAERPVVLVAGNHEFWHRVVSAELMAAGVAAARSRHVRFLERSSTVIADVRFVGGTMWTDFALYGPDARSLSMTHAAGANSDFALIFREPGSARTLWTKPLWTPEDARENHLAMRAYIDETLAQPFDGPTVVVSHHTPSLRSVAERWRQDPGTPAYASRLDDHILRWQPNLWIHGHVHDSADYRIGRTRVVCNPAGIGGENDAFDAGLVVEI